MNARSAACWTSAAAKVWRAPLRKLRPRDAVLGFDASGYAIALTAYYNLRLARFGDFATLPALRTGRPAGLRRAALPATRELDHDLPALASRPVQGRRLHRGVRPLGTRPRGDDHDFQLTRPAAFYRRRLRAVGHPLWVRTARLSPGYRRPPELLTPAEVTRPTAFAGMCNAANGSGSRHAAVPTAHELWRASTSALPTGPTPAPDVRLVRRPGCRPCQRATLGSVRADVSGWAGIRNPASGSTSKRGDPRWSSAWRWKTVLPLLRFKRFHVEPTVLARTTTVLVVAPLSGHHATLLRDAVRTLLQPTTGSTSPTGPTRA